MAFTDLGSLGATGGSGNNQVSLTLTTGADIAAGELVVVVVGDDNRTQIAGGGDDAATASVTVGGLTAALARQHTTDNLAAQAGASVSVWWLVPSVAIASGSSIVATFTSSTLSDATAISARHFSKDGNTVVTVVGTGALSNNAADPGSLTVATAAAVYLRVRAIAGEASAALGGLTVTAGGWVDWEDGNSAATGTTAEIAVRAEHVNSFSTSHASDPTWGTCDNASVYIVFGESPRPFTQVDRALPGQQPKVSTNLRNVSYRDFALLSAVEEEPPPEVEYLPCTVSDWGVPFGPIWNASVINWRHTAALSLSVKPPAGAEWTLPRQRIAGTSWVGPLGALLITPEEEAAVQPPANVGWPLPQWRLRFDTSWIRLPQQAAPVAVVQPPANVGWPLPLRAARVDRSWSKSPAVPPAEEPPVAEYMPCVVSYWGLPRPPYRMKRDWVSQPGILLAAAAEPEPEIEYVFRALFRATRITVRYNPAIHSQAQRTTRLSTVVAVKPPLSQVDKSVPRAVLRPKRDFVNQGGAYRTPPPPRPFTQGDRSNPRLLPFWLRDWLSRADALLALQTPAAPAPFTQADRSIPPRPARWLQDWINQSAVLITVVRPPAQGEFRNPLPALLVGRDWIDQSALLLAASVKPPVQGDWTNPRAAPAVARDWINRANALLAPAVVEAKPFTQADQSLPRAVAASHRDWISQGGAHRTPPVPPQPFTLQDRSNPRLGPIWLRDWIGEANALLATPPVVVDKPFTQVDQSNPRAAFQPQHDFVNQGGAHRTPPAPVVAKPFTQVDRSNPRTVATPTRDWFARTGALLATQVAKPFTQTEEVNPRAVAAVGRDWVSRSNALLATPVVAKPFTQQDRSNPQPDRPPPQDFIGQPYALLSPVPEKPAENYDWPNPQRLPAHLWRSWTFTPIEIIPAPPVITARPGNRTWGGRQDESRRNAADVGRHNTASGVRNNMPTDKRRN